MVVEWKGMLAEGTVVWNDLENNVLKIIKSLSTHCGLVTPYVDIDNGLLPEGTKSLPEPTRTYQQYGAMIFTWVQFYSETTWAVGIAQLTHHEVQGGGKNPETGGRGIFAPTADRVVN